jgi:hypothetical protein
MDSIPLALFEAGLVLFGWFESDQRPFRFEFDYLPAYPELLQALSHQTQSILDFGPSVERIVSSPEALPLGLALSLETGLPLVYSRSRGDTLDLIGAYNTGSTAALLTTANSNVTNKLLSRCREVGLEMQFGIALVEIEKGAKSEVFPIRTLLSLDDIVQHLCSTGYVSPGQAAAVQDWLRTIPHPDGEAP